MELNTSELKEKAKTLRAGDKIELSGTVYTSRDAAHKRIKQLIDEGGELPFEIDGAAIYYARRYGNRLMRSYDIRQNGPLRSPAARYGVIRNDRKGRTQACRSRRHKTQRCGILLCHRRCRRTRLSVHNRV